MIPEYEQLYLDMLKDIERTQNLELPERERAESCFWIANNYWEKLKQLVKRRAFRDESEEIEFFRNVKPEFTCYIEYFIILSEGLMFIPSDPARAINYWEEESKRFKRFCDKNNAFVEYLEKGTRYNDNNYFLRTNRVTEMRQPLSAIDSDVDFCTSHDFLVRGYYSYRKYFEYCRERVKELMLA